MWAKNYIEYIISEKIVPECQVIFIIYVPNSSFDKIDDEFMILNGPCRQIYILIIYIN